VALFFSSTVGVNMAPIQERFLAADPDMLAGIVASH
jgi:hypothetical protein